MPCSYSYSAVASSSVIGSGSSSTKDNMPANNGRCHRSCVPGRDNSIQNARRPQPGSVLEMVRAAITPVKPPYDVDLVESPGLASRRCNSPCDLTDLLDTPSDEIVIQYEQRYSRTFEDTQALTAIDIECMDEETREWFISFFEINEDLSRRENPSSASSSNKLPLQELYIDIVGHCPERASALLQRRIKRRNRQLGFNNGHVFVLRYDHLNGNNDELTGEEEPVVLRRCYSDSPMTEAIYLRQNIQENFEEQLEAEWWNNFESKSWEHNGAGEGMTEPNTDARPGLAEVALALNSWSLQLVPEIVVADPIRCQL
ncbi:hypothetical protein AOQ84DRAFT_197506 [Glonium stellatum]|uniref:Uncharacterized protein n=1 Tax=Glonium stellatum TaxID=574774 RepID=A0A8E2EPH9_9PEZI|nr:hypothetical protein AOQ84DRAFT_197506 [Glonium stellatum]